MKLRDLVLGSLLLVASWPHCYCSAAVQLASGRTVVAQTDDTDEVILTVGAPLASRPWLGCGYDVLAIDFAEAEQPLVASTFKKRWADANASWARMVDVRTWWKMNESQYAAEFNGLFRDTTNTTLFWTQWAEGQWAPTGGLPDPRNATAVTAWAAERAAFLQSMVVGNEVSNLEYYCFSNEEEDVGFPKKGYPGRGGNASNFITYNRAVRNALDGLGGAVAAVKLVGTDFFPCASSLDGVKGEASIDSYDCHHYGPEGYTDFTDILKPPLTISHAANKNFFLSEFGGPSCAGKLAADCHPSHPASGAPKTCKDSCAWFDTPNETQLGMILAEKVLATINNGGQSTGYWTFEDPLGGCPYWGLCRWNVSKASGSPATIDQLRCRSAHYSYGLLSKFLRGPAQVHTVVSTNAHNDTLASFIIGADGTSTLVVLNVAETALRSLRVQLPAVATSRKFYRYAVTEAEPPHNPAGDLPGPVTMNVKVSASGVLTDATGLPPRSVNLFVSAPPGGSVDAADPLPTPGLARSPSNCAYDPSGEQLQWEVRAEASYYRILRGGRHLWSTVETRLALEGQPTTEFAVQAVDRFGVASAAVACGGLGALSEAE